MRIRDGFKAIPAALQRQILRRGLMGCAFLLFSVVFLLMGYDALLVLPGVGFMLCAYSSNSTGEDIEPAQSCASISRRALRYTNGTGRCLSTTTSLSSSGRLPSLTNPNPRDILTL